MACCHWKLKALHSMKYVSRLFGLWMMVLLAVLLGTASCAFRQTSLESDFQAMVHVAQRKVYPALVYIKVIQRSLETGKEEMNSVSGSGVIISADGELLTNHHVIENAKEIRCLLNDGRNMRAELIGSDKDLDLALLKLEVGEEATPLPFASLFSGHVKEGDFVMALGAPYGLTKTVTIGIISSAKRVIPQSGHQYNTWYQTDAAIFPGNSGGPLININGEVIGLNTLGMAGRGMGFSLPSFVILDILPRMREYKSVNWSWFGFQFQPLHDFEKNIFFDFQNGVMVADTEAGSPAKLAGIQTNDRLLSCNGVPLTAINQEDLPEVVRHIAMLPLDTPAEFRFERNGEQFAVTLAPRAKDNAEAKEREFPRLGFSAKEINRFDNPTLYFHAPDGGVFVFGVTEDDYNYSRTSEIKKNDIIESVDGEKIRSMDELQAVYKRLLEAETVGKRIAVVVIRAGHRKQVIVTLRDANTSRKGDDDDDEEVDDED